MSATTATRFGPADWFERDAEKIVLFEDDASRLLTGFGCYSNATAENAKETLEEAIERFEKPEQLITDHEVQFTSMPRGTCPKPMCFKSSYAKWTSSTSKPG